MSTYLETVFCTIAPQSSLPHAWCLFESLRTHEPSGRLVLCLVEEEAGEAICPEYVELVLAKDVANSDFYDMAYKYSARELSAALKPLLIRHLLESGAERVIYMDPECFVFAPLDEVHDLLGGAASIIVTPQATHPITGMGKPNEIDFLRTGTFNLGFLAVRSGADARAFVDWWSERLRNLCVFDPMNGLFLDQKWVDLAPAFFDNVVILRGPGYNVGYWNAFQRKIERRPGGWHVDGHQLRFFHFMGLVREDVLQIAKGQDRLTVKELGPFTAEFEAYLARLASYALKPEVSSPYSYSQRWNGQPLDCQALRAALRRSMTAEVTDLSAFADERPVAALMEPHPELPVNEMFPISRLMHDALLDRPLIARRFPLFTAEGRARFLYWALVEGHEALEIDRALLPWRELTTPVDGALGGRFSVPPLMWLLWLADSGLRRTMSLERDETYALFLLELQKQISKGERPSWHLPAEYAQQVIIGEGRTGVTVAQYAVWLTREDLQDAFDIDTPAGRTGFVAWCAGPSPTAELPEVADFIRPLKRKKAAA